MKIFEIGTGYTSVPDRMGAATEIVVGALFHFADWQTAFAYSSEL